MDRYLPRACDEDFPFLHVRGAEIHQNVDHEEKVYDQVGVQKRVGLRVATS